MSKNKNYRANDSGENVRPKKRRKTIDETNVLDDSNDSSSTEEIKPYLECCVCLCSDLDDLAILVDNESPIKEDGFHPIATLSDCDEGIPLKNTIFLSCCKSHGICYQCLKTIATNFDHHPIGPKHSLIPCPYPFGDGCVSFAGTPNYFSHSDIKKLLTSEQYGKYLNHADRYQFPGYEIVKCPRPLLVNEGENEGEIVVCGAWTLVPTKLIKSTPPGYLIMECDQNPKCYRRSCYHCHSLVKRGRRVIRHENDIGGTVTDNNIFCERCVTSTENTNPRTLNRYFYRPTKQQNDGQPLFFRNDELVDELVLDQLIEMAESERLYIRCMECLTTIYKTEQCNTITHCGVERCYACGRSGTREQDMGDHWDTTGVKGCPRFDHSNFWNEWGSCEFACREGYCYSDTLGICVNQDHQIGINKMIEIRKKAHIYHAIKSLLPEMRNRIFQKAHTLKSLRPYLPKYMCSEYRAYSSDAIFEKLLQAQSAMFDLQSSIESIEQEMLSYRNRAESIVSTLNINVDGYDDHIRVPSNYIELSIDDSSESSDIDETIEQYTQSARTAQSGTITQTETRIEQYKSIIDKLSDFEFDKIDYPGTSVNTNNSFQKLKEKYFPY